MGRADFLKIGDWNVICQRTGIKAKRSQCRQEWNGLIVLRESFEERHPQDFLRSIRDDQSVDDPRSEAGDSFIDDSLGFEEILPGDL